MQARGLPNRTQTELSKRFQVAQKPIALFATEADNRTRAPLKALRGKVLEDAGVRFFEIEGYDCCGMRKGETAQ
jgi:hypothetical protein